ncbi:hypothetical protein [Niabella aurantiaca]|uniref:hypothetical protein n=1 Tax=Niabella aurantiaca TaxID=379900 RepID=UPI00035D9FD5|nr:hypothetical protein [Niabella aurantiaca]
MHSYVAENDIDKYLIRWNLEEEEDSTKAYPTDEFAREGWQLLDFMDKLKLPHSFNDYGAPNGYAYKLFTNRFTPAPQPAFNPKNKNRKPWWKFW